MRVSSRSAGSISAPTRPAASSVGERHFEMRIEPDPVPQLERVDGEFEVDQAARRRA